MEEIGNIILGLRLWAVMASSYSLFLSKLGAIVPNFRRKSSFPIDFSTCVRRFYGNQSGLEEMKITKAQRKEAQEALLDYLVLTRHLRYSDAENMSYNANFFLEKLLDMVEVKEQNVGRSVTRFLGYNPINEFEPFFESLGLFPLAISRLLPRNMTFLSDDQSLLHNYYTLCDFGVPRNKIGKIYENSRELFYCDRNTLASKLQAFSQLGFSWPFFPVLLARTSLVLSDKALADLVEVLNIIKSCGIEMEWVEKNLEGCRIFKWSTVLIVFRFFTTKGYDKEQLGLLIKEHPDILFHDSGDITLSLITFLFKLGFNVSQISAIFLRFPEAHVEEFYSNITRFFQFFRDIRVDEGAIGELIRSHIRWLGCCKIKSATTLRKQLNVSNSHFTRIIAEDPEALKKWAIGCEIERKASESKEAKKLLKQKFLMGVGLDKNSPKMERILRVYLGKSCELQKKFDFFVNAGLSREDVTSMFNDTPQISRQRVYVLQEKIDMIFKEFGYPLSEVAKFPYCLCYSVERIRLRLSMYELHKNVSGKTGKPPNSIFSCSEDKFIRNIVRNYPNGMEVWQQLKKQILGSD